MKTNPPANSCPSQGQTVHHVEISTLKKYNAPRFAIQWGGKWLYLFIAAFPNMPSCVLKCSTNVSSYDQSVSTTHICDVASCQVSKLTSKMSLNRNSRLLIFWNSAGNLDKTQKMEMTVQWWATDYSQPQMFTDGQIWESIEFLVACDCSQYSCTTPYFLHMLAQAGNLIQGCMPGLQKCSAFPGT